MTLTRSLVLIVALLVCVAEGQAVEKKPLTGEAKEIVEMVQQSQRTGVCDGDHDAYMAIWSDDAIMVLGRSEKSGKYDFSLDFAQLKTNSQAMHRGPQWRRRLMRHESEHITISGNTAVLRCRTYVFELRQLTAAEEIFRLRKTDEGWKVYENRYWPVASYTWYVTKKHRPTTWQDLDAQVEHLKKQGDTLALLNALFEAGRMEEAYPVAKQWTEKEEDNVTAWVYRGYSATRLGKTKEGMDAFHKALELDDDAPVPGYAHADDSGSW